MKHLEFSPDSHPNKYTRQRVWTSRNRFYSWVFSCLVTYLLVFREVDDIGCRHFLQKHVAGDSLPARTPSARPWTVWQLGYETRRLRRRRKTHSRWFFARSYTQRTTLDYLTIRLRNKQKSYLESDLFVAFFGQIIHEDKLTGKKPNLVNPLLRKCMLWLDLQTVLQNRDVMLPWQHNFWIKTIWSLSNDDGKENGQKAIGVGSKARTLHVHHVFLYIS